MPDLALNLFLSLGGHVELFDDKGFISPLEDLVENKSELCRQWWVLSTKSIAGDPRLPKLVPVMQQRLCRGAQHQLVSYDNKFTVRWRCGFDWKQRS